MVDRPPNGGPEKGTPEYDWLYGSRGAGSGAGPDSGADDATRVVPPSSGGGGRPDETRHLPVQPRPAEPRQQPAQRPTRSGTPQQPPQQPPAPPPARAPRGRGWRPRPRLRWIWALFLLWLVFLVATPIWALQKVDDVDAFPDGDRPGEQPGTTYLIVGSDKADDLTAEQRKAVRAGDRAGQRTDTIMLLHTGSGPNLLMSIPRDSYVEIPGYGTSKVNAAYAYDGARLLVETMEQNTGIRIDHYVEIGFGGVINMVDAVGGVEICPKRAMNDPDARLKIKKGCQEADGLTALGYARSRKTYTARGDVDRAAAQREVVSALGDKVLSPWTVLNPFRYVGVNTAGAESVRVSEGTGAFTLGKFAMAMTRVNGDKGLTCGVPISDLRVTWDAQRSRQMFDYIIDDKTDDIPKKLCTPSGLPK
ncbi:LCP family protein [Nocardioides pacificus]